MNICVMTIAPSPQCPRVMISQDRKYSHPEKGHLFMDIETPLPTLG